VLLEVDHYRLPMIDEPHGRQLTITQRPALPGPLTAAQREALTTVFAAHLAWPPVPGPLPVKLEAAARQLHVSDGAVAHGSKPLSNGPTSLGPIDKLA
jgi:hypothetical protein